MFKHIYKTLLCFISIFAFVSCKKDFLDLVPKGNQVAKTTEDYNLLMNSNTLYFYSGNSGWQLPVVMGDEIVAEAANFNSAPAQFQRAFRYEANIYELSSFSYDLTPLVQNLYLCNTVINEVDQSTGGTTQQKKIIKAEALATRAWVYFQLINYYGKPYSSTASTDPGFPIITEANVSQIATSRSTVQAVYDLIVKDLSEAIPELPIVSAIRTRMSKPAAEGLLGKVYLFMGQHALALPLFNLALQEINASTGSARLYNYNTAFAPGGAFLPINSINGPAGPGNNFDDLTESVVSKVFYSGNFNGNFQNDGLVLDAPTAALYAASDHRLKFYSATTPNNAPNPSGRLRKYGVKYTRFGLELADLYLLSAECKARLNNLSGAKTDIEILRSNRMPAVDATIPTTVAANQSLLIKYIIEERIREYALQGYRWFDMRRLSVDPLFTGNVYVHKLYNTNSTVSTYTLSQPDRWALRFPQPFLDANANLTNNP